MAAGTNRTLAHQRHERIVQEVRLRGTVRVADLAELLRVSNMTVRRDLDRLDEAGLVVKVHGGATAPSEHTSDEPGFDAKSLRNTHDKAAIARAASEFVIEGGAIGITAGTTTWRLAMKLTSIADLTIVTNSVRVAEVFNAHPRADRTMILTGGIRTPSDALVGPIAVAALGTLHVDVLFLGVHGISERAGFSTPNMLEADTNRAFVAASGRLIVLADHTKFGVTGLSTFARLADADVLITDDQTSEIDRAMLEDAVERVVLVSAAEPDPTDHEHAQLSRSA
jgi:DeoR/GlpR family transcriptional regulator of sugar metabolism